MNLNIKNIGPETRGLLYRLQAELELKNLQECITFLILYYYSEEEI
jgi:hypothetical protein